MAPDDQKLPQKLPPPGADHRPVSPVQSARRTWPRWIKFAIAAVLCVVVVIAIIQLLPKPAAPRTGGRFNAAGAIPVVTATVANGDMPIVLSALGTVTSLATVTVRARISGQLTDVYFKEGQDVNAGDLLAQVDPRPYQVALDQMQGQLARDQALLANAKIDLTRYQGLVAQGSIARQQADTQAALVQQYEGTVQTDQAQVDNAQLNLDYTRILAPVGGRVGLRQVDKGNYVQLGDTNGIVVITQLKPITVVFSVPEDNLQAVRKRLNAGATLPVTAYDRNQTAALATGVLATIDNLIDTTTGTIKLRATFDNKDEALFPNQFVNIRLQVDVIHDTPIIPTAAVQRGAPGTFVYVVNGADPNNQTVSVRPITLGPGEGERVSVAAGLKADEKIVVDGVDRLKDGAKIRQPTTPGATGGRAGAAPPANGAPPATSPAGALPGTTPSTEPPINPPAGATTPNTAPGATTPGQRSRPDGTPRRQRPPADGAPAPSPSPSP
jgi:multidrug efflux system membrane fusion protein